MRAPLQGLGDRRKPFCGPVRPPAAISRFSDKKRRKATGPNGKFGNETPFAEFRQKDRKNSVPYGVPTKISVRRGFSTKSSPNPRAVGSASRARNPGSPFPAGDAAISRFSDEKRGFRTGLDRLREEILGNSRFWDKKPAQFSEIQRKFPESSGIPRKFRRCAVFRRKARPIQGPLGAPPAPGIPGAPFRRGMPPFRGSHTKNRPPFEGFFKKSDGFYERRGGIS